MADENLLNMPMRCFSVVKVAVDAQLESQFSKGIKN